MFPGQGSQSVGMGKVFYDNFKSTRLLFEEASDALNLDMKKLCFEGPESTLALTENTQPALLLVSTAAFRAFEENTSFRPSFSAGHSLGEYSALVAAEVLQFKDALVCVRTRGQAMQSACPIGEGGMAAVMGLENGDVEKVCSWAEQRSGFTPLSPANFNAPGQIVISGRLRAIEWLKNNYSPEASGVGKKLKLIPLNVSAPFHSPLMKPAQDRMDILLTNTAFSMPRFPIVQNTTALESDNVDTLRRELILQVSAPVKWAQSVSRLKTLGVTKLIEFGSGKVLAGLVKKIDSEAFQTFNLQTIEDFKSLEEKVNS